MAIRLINGVVIDADTLDGLNAALAANQIPVLDGSAQIALANLVAAVCSETEADNKITAHTTADAHHEAITPAQVDTKVSDHAVLLTGIHGEVIVRKTANETVHESTVLQNDDHLFMAIAINEVWEFRLYLRITCGAMRTGTCNFTVPGGGSYLFHGTSVVAGTTSNTTIGKIGDTSISVIEGIVINGGNAGTFQFQWAQPTAADEDTIILADSCLIAHRVL
ncbi:hypothetical protein ES708_16321 [subsurface metagenome]